MEKRNIEAAKAFMVVHNKNIQVLNVQQLKALVRCLKKKRQQYYAFK
jgi:hypothetical protein